MLADRIAAEEPRPPARAGDAATVERDRARPARGRHRARRRRRRPSAELQAAIDRLAAADADHRRHPGLQGRASAACSSRSSTCSTTTCSSPSRSLLAATGGSAAPRARRSTTRCARCSPTCARSRSRPRCTPRPRTGAPPSSATGSSAPRPSSPSSSRRRIEQQIADRAWSGYQHAVRRQRHPRRAHRRRRRLRLAADAARRRRPFDG